MARVGADLAPEDAVIDRGVDQHQRKDDEAFVAIYEDNESWRELPHSSRDSLAAAEEALLVIREARNKAVEDAPFDPENYAWAMGKPMGRA
jgi:hypothetical protein